MSSSSDSDDISDFNMSVLKMTEEKITVKKHKFIKVIGDGNFSTCIAVKNGENSKYYCAKIANPSYVDENMLESYLVSKINSVFDTDTLPKIIRTDKFTYEGEKFMYSIYKLNSQSLEDILQNGDYPDGINETIVENITFQILTGLYILHNKINIVHMDLKPENIMIVDEKYVPREKEIQNKYSKMHSLFFGKIPQKKEEPTLNTDTKITLIDFNSCYHLKHGYFYDNTVTQTSHYRAPEMAASNYVHHGLDIWSLGCIVYELITNKLLFPADKHSSVSNKILLAEIENKLGKIPSQQSEWKTHIKNKTILDFILQTLNVNYLERIDVSKCFEHDWMKNMTAKSILMFQKIDTVCVKNLFDDFEKLFT
jgi:serine/threonine protein kinase